MGISNPEFFHSSLKLGGSTSNNDDMCTFSSQLASNSPTHAIGATGNDNSLYIEVSRRKHRLIDAQGALTRPSTGNSFLRWKPNILAIV